MRILFLGDIVARPGREAVISGLPEVRARLKADLVIANGENMAHGFGLNPEMVKALMVAGVDVFTGGNHSFDRSTIIPHMDSNAPEALPVLRPLNMIGNPPGQGSYVWEGQGRRVLILNVILGLFLMQVNDPFEALEQMLPLQGAPAVHGFDAIVVDVHGETTSEKNALAHYLDGRVSLLVGTHTHVPTADHRVLKGGTAYQTDAGMCGVVESVIGMSPDTSLPRMMGVVPKPHLEPAQGTASLCGVFVTTDENGLARQVAPLRTGGGLTPAWPDF